MSLLIVLVCSNITARTGAEDDCSIIN